MITMIHGIIIHGTIPGIILTVRAFPSGSGSEWDGDWAIHGTAGVIPGTDTTVLITVTGIIHITDGAMATPTGEDTGTVTGTVITMAAGPILSISGIMQIIMMAGRIHTDTGVPGRDTQPVV